MHGRNAADPPPATKDDDPDPAATVPAIYRYHPVDNGWGDIGYRSG